jgi:hypothetical protein
MRIAVVERTVTCVIVPGDLQQAKAVKQPPHVHGTVHSSVGVTLPRVVPRDADLCVDESKGEVTRRRLNANLLPTPSAADI